jgi:hypothetical protein
MNRQMPLFASDCLQSLHVTLFTNKTKEVHFCVLKTRSDSKSEENYPIQFIRDTPSLDRTIL